MKEKKKVVQLNILISCIMHTLEPLMQSTSMENAACVDYGVSLVHSTLFTVWKILNVKSITRPVILRKSRKNRMDFFFFFF